jgi:hypothetical protein
MKLATVSQMKAIEREAELQQTEVSDFGVRVVTT